MEKDSLMRFKSIAECSPWNILQYFWPVLSDNLSWKPIFVFFLSGCLIQVLLYMIFGREEACLHLGQLIRFWYFIADNGQDFSYVTKI